MSQIKASKPQIKASKPQIKASRISVICRKKFAPIGMSLSLSRRVLTHSLVFLVGSTSPNFQGETADLVRNFVEGCRLWRPILGMVENATWG